MPSPLATCPPPKKNNDPGYATVYLIQQGCVIIVIMRIQLVQKRLSFQTLDSKRAKDDGGQILSFRFVYWSYLWVECFLGG